jgi:hypothetical protein
MALEFDKKHWQTCGPLGFPQLDKQAKQLEVLLRTLPRQKEYAYRHAVVTKAPTETNPGERSDVSWISTESVDRTGEVVISKGMNSSQFALNPLVTLQHNYYVPPVGKSLWQKRIKDGDLVGIKAKTQYPTAPANWNQADAWPPDKVFSLVQAGLLTGKSIGFLPTKVHFADQKESTKNNWPAGTLVFDEWVLLEYACVFIPANQDSLVEQVSKGAVVDPWAIAQLCNIFQLDPKSLTGNAPGAVSTTTIPRSFVTLEEFQRAMEARLQNIAWETLVARQVQEVLDRTRGRV